jgi:hypothetical protein
MSIAASEWAWKQFISPQRKLVLLDLADHHNGDDGRCFPSVATIAAETRLCERTVQSHLRGLQEQGLVLIRERRGTSSQFVLQFGTTIAPKEPRPVPVDRRRFRQPALAEALGATPAAVAAEPPASPVDPKPPAYRPPTREELDVFTATTVMLATPADAAATPASVAATPADDDIEPPQPLHPNLNLEPEDKSEGEAVERAGGRAHATPPPRVEKIREGKARGCHLPSDWRPSTEDRAFAFTRDLDPLVEAERFRAHHQALGSVRADWSAAFRSWCLKAPLFADRRPPARKRHGGTMPDWLVDHLTAKRREAEAEAVWP